MDLLISGRQMGKTTAHKRAIDEMVAVKIMGQTPEWREKMRGGCLCGRSEECSLCSWPLRYSEKIEYAMEVFEKALKGCAIRFEKNYLYATDNRANCWLISDDYQDFDVHVIGCARTLPMAICLAALRDADEAAPPAPAPEES